jgi:uncharacterized Zn-binding protein involved in type VI secretion
MNPICTDCNVEMRCVENGVTVAHVDTPHWVRKGDRYSCPQCRNEFITSLGEAYDSNVDPIVIVEDAIADAKLEVIQRPFDWMKEL